MTKSLLHASATSERVHPPFPIMMAFPSFKLVPAGHSSEENTHVPGQLKMDSCRAFPACHSALYPFERGLALASEAHSPRITSELPLESQGKGWGDLTVFQVLHRPNQKEDRDAVSAANCRKRHSPSAARDAREVTLTSFLSWKSLPLLRVCLTIPLVSHVFLVSLHKTCFDFVHTHECLHLLSSLV